MSTRLEDHADPHRPASRVVRFARVLWAAALVTLAGLALPRAWAALVVVVALVVVGVLIPWMTAAGVRGRLTFPVRRGQVGQPLAVRVTLRCIRPWPVFGLVVRGGWGDPRGPDRDPVTIAVPGLPARRVREVATTVVPTRRGVYPAHAPTLECGFPFGMRFVRRPIEASGRVVVWPEVVTLAASREQGDGGGVPARRSRTAGAGGEVVGTRPYRAGEPLHRVHWKQTARHERLVALETGAAAHRAVTLIVESAVAVHVRRPGADSLDRALSVAASLAAGFVDAGVHVTLAFESGGVFSAATRSQLAPGFDAMARLTGAGAGLDELLARVVRVRGAATFVVTTVAGWQRARAAGLTGGRFVLIDEGGGGGPPPGVPVVPLDDPGHDRLRSAWKEVAGG